MSPQNQVTKPPAGIGLTKDLIHTQKLIDGARRSAGRLSQQGRWFARRITSSLQPPKGVLVYHPSYRLPPNPIADPDRQTHIINYILSLGFSPRVLISSVPPRAADMLRVHDPDYLSRLDEPSGIAPIFLDDAAAPAFLFAQRWAAAGTTHAAAIALRRRETLRAVINLGGGFHHAHRDHGGGFCAINDIAIAIARLRHDGFAGRILIVDVDQHHGDGTKAIFAKDPEVFTYSIHIEDLNAEPAVANLDVALGSAIADGTYLTELKKSLAPFAASCRPDLIFYVAGVDVAMNDALGGFLLTDDAIASRDAFALDIALGIPTVVVLAGGYGPDAWRHTARFAVRILSNQDQPIASGIERRVNKFRRIRTSLSATDLMTDPSADLEIRESDVLGDLLTKQPGPKLLGYYSPYGLEIAFERYGLAEHLRRRGYANFHIDLETRSGLGEGFRVFGSDADSASLPPSETASVTHPHKPGELLIEVVLNTAYQEAPFSGLLKLLQIEWLLLQDPRRPATPDKPLLPGQRFPGLGCSEIVIGMLLMSAERLDFDGLSLIPAHYHVATWARSLFRFLSPEDEAEYVELARMLATTAPTAVAQRMAAQSITWQGKRMICPISARLKGWLESSDYAERVEREAKRRTQRD